MSIIINIDVMLAKRKMSVTELSERVGITMANISILKNGKAKAIKLSTLNSICKAQSFLKNIKIMYRPVAQDSRTTARPSTHDDLTAIQPCDRTAAKFL